MSFTADWLATRRAADARARNPDVASRLSAHFSGKQSCRVLDLGCGTGANLEATSVLLPREQDWTLVDNDPTLLSHLEPTATVRYRAIQADLAQDLEGLFDTPPDLVTASALFDLAGADFVDHLVQLVTGAAAVFFTVLTYDGEEDWSPSHPNDSAILSAFHTDQHADKGLGPALGPDATLYLARSLTKAGYAVHLGKSDWELHHSTDYTLIRMLADGIHTATLPALGHVADAWFAARKNTDAVRIGHMDLVAFPA